MPVVDAGRVGRPATVTIVDIPEIWPRAVIGVLSVDAPGQNQFHFSNRADPFFAPPGATAKPLVVTSTYGLVGRAIEQSAADTQAKSEAFGDEILKVYPDLDLRKEFLGALQASLEARGVKVTVLGLGQPRSPRLLWPARDAAGQSYPSLSLSDTPPVDSDIVLQVSPVALYNAIGALHNYNLNVSVGVALYKGRSREFLGRQTLFFKATSSPSYARYDDLARDLKVAVPPMREALLQLARSAADLASGNTR